MTIGDYVGMAAGLVITLLFFYVGIRIGRRNRTRPILKYVSDFDRLISKDDAILSDGIVVTQRGHKVESISRTCIALWNDRGDTINRSDILLSDPLRFSLESGDKVIQARILSKSREQNAFEIKVHESSSDVTIEFDFLDSEDGAVVEIIHQGAKAIRLAGTVRGAAIERSGSADLSSGNLGILAHAGYWKRFRRYWFRRDADKLGKLAFYLVNLAVVLGGFAAIFTLYKLRKPHLVPLGDHDLATIKGQRVFADKVRKVGAIQEYPPVWVVGGLGLLIIVMVFGMLHSPVRSVIPRKILSTYTTPDDSSLP